MKDEKSGQRRKGAVMVLKVTNHRTEVWWFCVCLLDAGDPRETTL
jgi:hypothetical protein